MNIRFFRSHWKLVAAAVLTSCILLVVLTWLLSNPYTVVNAGNGKIYKVNRRTGESWLLVGGRQVPVSDSTSAGESSTGVMRENIALEMAKQDWFLRERLPNLYPDAPGYISRNDEFINHILETTPEATIKGWKCKMVDTDTYLVSCTFELGGQFRGFFFEVNLNTETVRHIFPNSPLAKRYRIDSTTLFDPENASGTEPDWLLEDYKPIDKQSSNRKEWQTRDRIDTEANNKPRGFSDEILTSVEIQSDHNSAERNSYKSER